MDSHSHKYQRSCSCHVNYNTNYTTQKSDKLTLSIETFYSRFQINQIAKSSNAMKTKGVSFHLLFCYLISVIFSNKTAYRDFLMNKDSLIFSDKTFRNLLNEGRINWTSSPHFFAQLSLNSFDHSPY